ncbi:MAG: hypothetical protein R6X18_04680 [Chloroflexota bacterium]|jgi:hypothetical protein
MNPFTKYLRQWSGDSELTAFIDDWDRLERLVISVYRGKLEPEAAAAEFDLVWPRLGKRYQKWQEILMPYWTNTQVAGKAVETDPFRLLLGLPNPLAIPGNWQLMQHLPAAREAINRYLADHS